MKRLMLAAVALLVALTPLLAIAEESSPESLVKAFYTWYLQQSEREFTVEGVKPPFYDDAIYDYVAKRSIDILREDRQLYPEDGDGHYESCGSDYFLGVQDWDAENWLNNISIKPSFMAGSVVVVPVTLGSDMITNMLVLVSRQGDNSWRITRVVSPECTP